MQFLHRRKKNPPAVIIVSMIDVLLVVLIFLMVTTTSKQQPTVKLALPESKQSKVGAIENTVIITIPKEGPIYLQRDAIPFDRLEEKLQAAIQQNPQMLMAIRADTDAPFGNVIKVMDAAKACGIKVVSAYIKGGPAK